MASRSSVETEFGAQMRALRIRRGWSLAQLGEQVQLTRQGVQRIEAGEVGSPLSTLDRIATALGSTIPEMLGGRPVDGVRRRPSSNRSKN
jgi:transcriptional regulator with XRE-family HTH domain